MSDGDQHDCSERLAAFLDAGAPLPKPLQLVVRAAFMAGYAGRCEHEQRAGSTGLLLKWSSGTTPETECTFVNDTPHTLDVAVEVDGPDPMHVRVRVSEAPTVH